MAKESDKATVLELKVASVCVGVSGSKEELVVVRRSLLLCCFYIPAQIVNLV